ncbi:hypothetical protein ACH5RR_023313 [Cinchona calisaya]|uniref:Uncharacterized protein n=1 Tax=Cinchona calisaya TaxID=153742 RepID=A0ABD2ZAA9_9GENT
MVDIAASSLRLELSQVNRPRELSKKLLDPREESSLTAAYLIDQLRFPSLSTIVLVANIVSSLVYYRSAAARYWYPH